MVFFFFLLLLGRSSVAHHQDNEPGSGADGWIDRRTCTLPRSPSAQYYRRGAGPTPSRHRADCQAFGGVSGSPATGLPSSRPGRSRRRRGQARARGPCTLLCTTTWSPVHRRRRSPTRSGPRSPVSAASRPCRARRRRCAAASFGSAMRTLPSRVARSISGDTCAPRLDERRCFDDDLGRARPAKAADLGLGHLAFELDLARP